MGTNLFHLSRDVTDIKAQTESHSLVPPVLRCNPYTNASNKSTPITQSICHDIFHLRRGWNKESLLAYTHAARGNSPSLIPPVHRCNPYTNASNKSTPIKQNICHYMFHLGRGWNKRERLRIIHRLGTRY